ncbi:hypothetical protein [Nocardioides sp.]|uniref:hypothetical protein n=1 Tax=Nocardioides sp. TaxID=35761 RepID=UPI0039E51930
MLLSLVTAVVSTAVTGCGEDGSGGDTSKSALDTPFELHAVTDGQEVSGHGISLVVPADWTASAEEKLDAQGRTYEWAVQAPTSGTDFPPFVNMSMGVPGQTSTGFDAAPEALKTLEGISPDFEVLDEGELDVPGVDHAYQIHYERASNYQGQSVKVELVQVFLDMPDDVLSSVRFQAPAGSFDDSGLEDVLNSLTVAVRS